MRKMNLSLGTNFDNELLHKISDTNVTLVYGKLPNDIFGGGRPSMALPDISVKDLKSHIELAHQYGIEFNYLMNTNCMDNMEFESNFNRKLLDTIKWLDNIGVDWITVALPYLVEVIKKVAPRIKVSLSTFAYVDTIQKAIEFEKLGVDEITLPEGLNRNFALLEKMCQSVNCHIQLIATNLCMAACPYRFYHANSQSHASQKDHVSKGITFDYCMLKCTEKTLHNPVEAIKMPWIRPEDTWAYEEIGVSSLKITERMKKTEVLSDIAHAYTARSYGGMLNRLLNFRVKEDFIQPKHDMIMETTDFNKELILDSRELLFQRKIEIDNSKLDGFIDFFKKNKRDCRNVLCGTECNHCHQYAEKSVVMNSEEATKAANKIQTLIEDATSGGMYRKEIKDQFVWPEKVEHILNRFLEKKPEFVRESSRLMIKKSSEESACSDGRTIISLEDVAKANYSLTPDEFKADFIASVKSMGIVLQLN